VLADTAAGKNSATMFSSTDAAKAATGSTIVNKPKHQWTYAWPRYDQKPATPEKWKYRRKG